MMLLGLSVHVNIEYVCTDLKMYCDFLKGSHFKTWPSMNSSSKLVSVSSK